MSLVYNSLKSEHPEAAFIISGDKNNLDESKILALNCNFRQIVSKNTRKEKVLTVIITDLHRFYHNPLVIPPVPLDVRNIGVPSDHSGVYAEPFTLTHQQRVPEVRHQSVRPRPDSLVKKFGKLITTED